MLAFNVDKFQKILSTASHATTPDMEALSALRIAQGMLRRVGFAFSDLTVSPRKPDENARELRQRIVQLEDAAETRGRLIVTLQAQNADLQARNEALTAALAAAKKAWPERIQEPVAIDVVAKVEDGTPPLLIEDGSTLDATVPFEKFLDAAKPHFSTSKGWFRPHWTKQFCRDFDVSREEVERWRFANAVPQSVLEKLNSAGDCMEAEAPLADAAVVAKGPEETVPYAEFRDIVIDLLDLAPSCVPKWVRFFTERTGISGATVKEWRLSGVVPLSAIRISGIVEAGFGEEDADVSSDEDTNVEASRLKRNRTTWTSEMKDHLLEMITGSEKLGYLEMATRINERFGTQVTRAGIGMARQRLINDMN